MLLPGHRSAHTDEVVRSDRRWLLVAMAVFVATLVGLFGAHAIYRATGPHPQVTVLIRRVKGLTRRVLQGWRRRKTFEARSGTAVRTARRDPPAPAG